MLPVQEYSKAGILVVLLSIPVFLLELLGGVVLFRKICVQKNTRERKYLILYVYIFLLIIAYMQYNFKLPFYSTVKASFLSSLLVPFCYFLYQGGAYVHNMLSQKFKNIFIYILILFITIYIKLIMKHFWVQSVWYVVQKS
jgi:hypothetical protein